MEIKDNSLKLVLGLVSLIMLVYHLINLFLFWSDIPNRIAIHFTNGEPDNWGSKYFLLIMPFIGVITWWLIGLLTKHPDKLNYINLSDKNCEEQYKKTSKILILNQNIYFIIFILTNEAFLRYTTDRENDLFIFLPIALLVVSLLSFLYNLFWATRLKA